MPKAKTPSMNAMLNYLGRAWGRVELLKFEATNGHKQLWQCSQKSLSQSHEILWFIGRDAATAVRRAYRAVKKGAER